MALTSTGYQIDTYSLAQSFFVEETQGVFLLGVDLFFKSTTNPDTSLPVMIELRPMNNGFPSSTITIPGSQTSVNRSGIQFSSNASVATRFDFDEPIFLSGLKDYAIVVSTNTSFYELFASVSDTFVIGSTVERISKQQTLGSLFFSQNAATFTPAQELDLSFKLHKAVFTSNSGTAVLRHASLPQTTLLPNPIRTTLGSGRIEVFSPGHGFQPNDKVLIDINGGGSVGGLDSSVLSGTHIIDSADLFNFVYTVGSNATSTVDGGGENNVRSEKNIPYNKVYPSIQILEPRGTKVGAAYKPTSTHSRRDTGFGNATASQRYVKNPSFNPLILNQDNTSNQMHAIITDRLIDSAGITNKSAEVSLNLTTDDTGLSPVIDMQRASLTLIQNLIDNQFGVPSINFATENTASGGSEASKHITKVVTLEEPAVGLKIFLGANRPDSTDFEVYFRTANQDEDITLVNFTLLQEEGTNPSDENPLVFRDYEYLAGGQGGDLPAFTKFQVKIVMRSTNQAKSPMFQDLRIIALSV